jgi:hypothetical protein
MLILAGLMLAALMGTPESVYDFRLPNGTGHVVVDRTPTHDDGSLLMDVKYRRGEVRAVTSSRQHVIHCPSCIHLTVDPPDPTRTMLYPIGEFWAAAWGEAVWVYDRRNLLGTGRIIVDTTPFRDDGSLTLIISMRNDAPRRIWTNRTTVLDPDYPRHYVRLRVEPPTQ